jgi:hypothetical protein
MIRGEVNGRRTGGAGEVTRRGGRYKEVVGEQQAMGAAKTRAGIQQATQRRGGGERSAGASGPDSGDGDGDGDVVVVAGEYFARLLVAVEVRGRGSAKQESSVGGLLLIVEVVAVGRSIAFASAQPRPVLACDAATSLRRRA